MYVYAYLYLYLYLLCICTHTYCIHIYVCVCVCVYVCVFEDEHLYSLVFVRRAGRHTIQPTSARFSIYAYAWSIFDRYRGVADSWLWVPELSFNPWIAFRMAFAQGVALVLECGWIKGLGRLFLQLLPLVLPINTWSLSLSLSFWISAKHVFSFKIGVNQ